LFRKSKVSGFAWEHKSSLIWMPVL
jgi:hypothetical protein